MYENMTRIELEARLHFLEENAVYTAAELRKANERIEKLTEKNKKLNELVKEYKADNDRLGELFKLAQERLFGKRSERIIV